MDFKREVAKEDFCSAHRLLRNFDFQFNTDWAEFRSEQTKYEDLFTKAFHKFVKKLVDKGKIQKAAVWIQAILFPSYAEERLIKNCFAFGNLYEPISSGRVQEINDFAYWLDKSGESSFSIPILLNIVHANPTRKVAWLNLRDAAHKTGDEYISWWAGLNYGKLTNRPSLRYLPSLANNSVKMKMVGDRMIANFNRLEEIPPDFFSLDVSTIKTEYSAEERAVHVWIVIKPIKDFMLDENIFQAGAERQVSIDWLHYYDKKRRYRLKNRPLAP